MSTLNKTQLIAVVAEREDVSKALAERIISTALNQIAGEVKGGGSVDLHGFGKFDSSHSPARVGRNPQTGAAINIAAKDNIKFRPAKALKDLLNS